MSGAWVEAASLCFSGLSARPALVQSGRARGQAASAGSALASSPPAPHFGRYERHLGAPEGPRVSRCHLSEQWRRRGRQELRGARGCHLGSSRPAGARVCADPAAVSATTTQNSSAKRASSAADTPGAACGDRDGPLRRARAALPPLSSLAPTNTPVAPHAAHPDLPVLPAPWRKPVALRPRGPGPPVPPGGSGTATGASPGESTARRASGRART